MTQEISRFMELALELAKSSTCAKLHYGAVIVRDEEVLGTGYNKSNPILKEELCAKECIRLQYISGTHLHLCCTTHAEVTAIIDAQQNHGDISRSTIYLAAQLPDGSVVKQDEFYCLQCANTMAAAGIENIVLNSREGEKTISMDEALRYTARLALEGE